MNFKIIIFMTVISIGFLILLIFTKNKEESITFYFLKPLTIISIIILGILSDNVEYNIINQFILFGLLFSFLGDVFLMLGEKEFLIGMRAFLLTHFCYISAFIWDGFIINYIVLIIIR